MLALQIILNKKAGKRLTWENNGALAPPRQDNTSRLSTLQCQWRGVETSDDAGATCVVQGECYAADGWGAAPHPSWDRAAQNDGVAAGGEIQQVNNEQAHSSAHPSVRSLQPRSHNVYSAYSTPSSKGQVKS